VCKECVEKREWAEAIKADTAAAAKSAARPSPSTASSSAASAAAAPPPAAAVCLVCAKGGAKLHTCSRCRSLYCSLICLKQHSSGDINQCAAVCSLPPLSIADEDRITEAEIETQWPRLQQRMLALLPLGPLSNGFRVRFAELYPSHFASLVQLYPPQPAMPWWNSASAVCAEFRASMQIFAFGMHAAVCETNCAYTSAALVFRGRVTRLAQLDGLIHLKFFPPLPPVLDESRLFHRLLRYLIYYFRHVDPSFINPQLRPLIDVQSDDDGEFTDAADTAEPRGHGSFTSDSEH